MDSINDWEAISRVHEASHEYIGKVVKFRGKHDGHLFRSYILGCDGKPLEQYSSNQKCWPGISQNNAMLGLFSVIT